MIQLEDLRPNAAVRGILPDAIATVVSVQRYGSEALELTYKTPTGRVAQELLYRHDESRLEVVEQGRPGSFDGDGALFGLVSEAQRIRLAHLFDPVLAVHTAVVEPLLEKLELVRQALGGQVFDVLGKLQFEGRALRDLLIDAIRYGDQPEVRARLTTVLDHALDRAHLRDLLEERALAHDAMDASRVQRIREEMERAETRRLQPHRIESSFLEALQRLGGSVKQRESRRYSEGAPDVLLECSRAQTSAPIRS